MGGEKFLERMLALAEGGEKKLGGKKRVDSSIRWAHNEQEGVEVLGLTPLPAEATR